MIAKWMHDLLILAFDWFLQIYPFVDILQFDSANDPNFPEV
jgi:hypothetical protein